MSSFKSILITGCSAGGIGAALAFALAHRGHHVFVTARSTNKIPETLQSLGNVTVLSVDVTDAASVAAAVDSVVKSGRGLDVLVNNAGIEYVQPVLDMDLVVAQRLMDVNLWGPVRLMQGFSNLLIASRGRIVNVSSTASVINSPWLASYAASKAALNKVSETLRLELAPFGVTVISILPGVINTKLHTNNMMSFDLPTTSRYAVISDIIGGWAMGESQPKDGASADDFAKMVMNDVLGTSSGVVSRGPYASLLRCIGEWTPRWFSDYVFSLNQGISELCKESARIRGKTE